MLNRLVKMKFSTVSKFVFLGGRALCFENRNKCEALCNFSFPEWPSRWKEHHPPCSSKSSGMPALPREETRFSKEKLRVPPDPR